MKLLRVKKNHQVGAYSLSSVGGVRDREYLFDIKKTDVLIDLCITSSTSFPPPSESAWNMYHAVLLNNRIIWILDMSWRTRLEEIE